MAWRQGRETGSFQNPGWIPDAGRGGPTLVTKQHQRKDISKLHGSGSFPQGQLRPEPGARSHVYTARFPEPAGQSQSGLQGWPREAGARRGRLGLLPVRTRQLQKQRGRRIATPHLVSLPVGGQPAGLLLPGPGCGGGRRCSRPRRVKAVGEQERGLLSVVLCLGFCVQDSTNQHSEPPTERRFWWG